ncbi:MAG: DMT family transporter [Rickettsiales bacterium]
MSYKKIHPILYLLALVPPLMGAGNFVLAKGMTAEIGPFALLFYRWFFALLFMTPIIAHGIKKDWKEIIKHRKYIFFTSLPAVVLFNTFSYLALRNTDSMNASILTSTFPMFVIILEKIIFGDKFTSIKFVSVLLAMFGAITIIMDGQYFILTKLFSSWGDLLALAASFTWATYAILLRKRPATINNRNFTWAMMVPGVVIILPLYLIEEIYFIHTDITSLNFALTIFFLSFMVSIVGLLAWSFSVEKLGALNASLFFYFAPVFTIILSIIFLGEVLTSARLIGLCFVLFGVTLPIISNVFKKKELESAEGL